MAKSSGGVRNNRGSYDYYKSTSNNIQSVINDLNNTGHSERKPIVIGLVDKEMIVYASNNNIDLGSKRIYFTAKQIAHALRITKKNSGKSIPESALVNFPQDRKKMHLYFEMGGVFVYTDMINKFIVHPNYKIKVKKGKTKVVNFLTAGKVIDPTEFKQSRYKKIR
ncbi:hypothetical protein ACF3N7_05330 [Cruoricaptor ignavus]|uniref:hypothetical protein n=1 Tax=Cruoricaptor ignavus TaxID=1118202 RepID=UPI00370D2D04